VTLSNGQIRCRQVTSGGSFGSNPLAQHIGVGKGAKITSIEVTWPTSKTKQVFTNVAPNQYLEVKELAKTFTVRPIKPIALKLSEPTHLHMN
jgi:hypothetical protein